MAETSVSRLFTLADELLLQIIKHVDSKCDLSSLALTCSRLQTFAEPFLYQSILVRQGKQAIRLCNSIQKRPARGSSIRKLEIRYPYEYKEGIEVLNQGLKEMRQLKEFVLETPCSNDSHALFSGFQSKGKIDYADYFTWASSMRIDEPLRVQVPLQSFTLHSHNDNGPTHSRTSFNLGRNAIIFLHPTLRNLTISCFDVNQDVGKYLSFHQSRTALKSLTFDECNIHLKGLAAILSKPKALERLTLGERIFHLDETSLIWSSNFSAKLFMQAVALQKDSLQYLKHIRSEGLSVPSIKTSSLSMNEYSSLKEMELFSSSFLISILKAADPPWTLTAPPNLQVLRIHQASTAMDFQPNSMPTALLDPLEDMLRGLSHVPQLDYVSDCWRTHSEYISNSSWVEKSTRKRVIDFVDELSRRNVKRLKIFFRKHHGYIPPYMYGEQLPEEVLAYDSEKWMVFGGTPFPEEQDK